MQRSRQPSKVKRVTTQKESRSSSNSPARSISTLSHAIHTPSTTRTTTSKTTSTRTRSIATTRTNSSSVVSSRRTFTSRVHGGLSDQDRIFTNLYNKNDAGIDGAMKRVCLFYSPIFMISLISIDVLPVYPLLQPIYLAIFCSICSISIHPVSTIPS